MGSAIDSASRRVKGRFLVSKGMGIFTLLTMVAWGNFAVATFEICRHSDGQTHLFFSGGSCAGLHVEEAGHSHDHGHMDGTHDCGDNHHEDHHEPCDHESYSLDHDWSLSGSRIALASSAQILTLSIEGTTSALAPRVGVGDPSNGFSRAPPGESESTLSYLRTIRLLI